MMRVAIVGAGGRMGRTLLEAVESSPNLQMGAATERPGSSLLGTDAGELAGTGKSGIILVDNLQQSIDDFDVLIDFTAPASTIEHLAICREHGKKIVIGTTGFDDQQKQQITDAAVDIGIIFAPNMSVGVNLCF